MGIFGFFKSQFIEVIEWTDPGADTMVYRFPVQNTDYRDIKYKHILLPIWILT
ncbi:hypothetical protein AB1K83_05265 [Sporosarcina sp. 179-K 3D1 HS]|uniref:hypothetical protein n=1 Tax=Sporosarcina sp. 179-K 3D1 HS TaxID=3232169 RepID=UPI0039A137C2